MQLRTRAALGLGATVSALATTVALSPGAHADPFLTLHQKASVQTLVKKPGKTVTFTGTQTATIDLGATTDNVSADLSLGSATMPVDLPIIPGVWSIPGVATATLKIEPTAPAKGTLSNGSLDISQSFNVRITKLTPAGLPWLNLAPSTCKTSVPASMKLTGTFATPLVLSSDDYTIPSFKGCGFLLDPVITELTSGSGNTVTATFTNE
ncbi:hypothetical protein [Luteipulveratus halotolerans]|uniref:Uncharacterized protein n=1 Tax=Luteipulveratus halotolerans TaxID=1631356 RepID=A0A0L6CID2_9MICO|nr:hypothetical protein [Luteipulveratus halotolerans]KNX37469.1 hypothetical protein VV01_10440 [Luteipulveratus halotolerans]